MLYITAFILGSIWGSFSNVCIYRLPKNEGVVASRSYCPSCSKTIRWYDNIPLFSFILLKAKCRYCATKISPQYFIVELVSAIIFTSIYFFYGFTFTSLLLIVLCVFFIVIFFIDLAHYIIPNELTFPLMVIGFAKSFYPNLDPSIFPNFLNSLIGGVIGYLIIWLIIFLYKKLKDKEGMGLGDAKLLSAIGFWFGWISIPYILIFSSITALVISIPSLINKSKNMSSQIPFGPYIVFGTIIYFTVMEKILNLIS